MAYTFTQINDPKAGSGQGTGTTPLSINNQGHIAGYYYDNSLAEYGFLDTNGSFTDTSIPTPTLPSVSVPGAQTTNVEGVNALGQIVGYYYNNDGPYTGSYIAHGFVDTSGTFTTIDFPAAIAYASTFVYGINDAGQIVGSYFDGYTYHGFVDTNGAFTIIDAPGANSDFGTEVVGINDSGEIIGYYLDSGYTTHGFSATPPAGAQTSVITGSVGEQLISDESEVTPFAGVPDLGLNSNALATKVIITDGNPGATDSVSIVLTDAQGVVSDADGKLVGAGLVESQPGIYTLAAADPATVSKELDALVFVPTPHQVAPDDLVTTTFTIRDFNSADPNVAVVDSSTKIIVAAKDDAPLISGTQAGQQVSNNAAIKPFSQVNIIEVDSGVEDSATIVLSGAGGTLSGAGLSATGTAGTYSLTATTPATLSSELDALSFTPASALPGMSATTTFSLTVTQADGGTLATTDDATTVTNTVVAQKSTISGAKANQTTTDEASIKPFASVTLTDPNLGATDFVTISLSNAAGSLTLADGTLSGPGLSVGLFAGSYYLPQSDPATLTQELDALVFTPTAHQVAPGQQVITSFTISDENSYIQTTSNSTTSVVATAVNDAPTITGTKAGQATTNYATVNPFAGVSISDPDVGAQVSLTISVASVFFGGGGTLAGAGLSQTATPGTYTLAAASPATLTAELDALSFTPANAPPGTVGTTSFDLTASQTAGGSTASTSDSTTTVANSVIPELSYFTGTRAGQTTTDAATIKPFAGVRLIDPNGPYSTDAVEILLVNASNVATDTNGTLSGAGLTKTGTGAYTLSAAGAAAITTELDSLVFTPSKVPSGSSVVTSFTLLAFNSVITAGPSANSGTSVVTSGPPVVASTITVPPADRSQTTTGIAAVTPFAGVTVADSNSGSPTETVTVTPSTTSLGKLADPNASTDGSTTASSGAITLKGSAGAVTSALDALTFTPAYGQSGQVTFTIADLNSVASTPATATAALSVHLPPAPTQVQLQQIGADLLHFLTDEISDRSTTADTSALTSDLTTLDVSQAELGQLLDQALTASKLASTAASTLSTDIAALWYPKITADLSHAGQGLGADLTGMVATTAGAAVDDLLRVRVGQSASAALTATLHDFKLA